MPPFDDFAILPGSVRRLRLGYRLNAAENFDDIEVTVQVRRKKELDFEHLKSRNKTLSLQELEEEHGASPKDLSHVLNFGEQFGMDLVEINPGQRTITFRCNAEQVLSAFKVHVFETQTHGISSRTRVGPIFIPKELINIVTGVFGLDSRPQAYPHIRHGSAVEQHAKPNAFDGDSLAGIYDFPISTGKNQTIALIELGGGYLNSDLKKFFSSLNIPQPRVRNVSVNGAKNLPFVDKGADTEVALDIEVAGATAPGADIVVYFAPNNDQSFLKAVLTAIHDEINRPSIISISWGAAENVWTEQQMLAMNEAFKSAAAMGISVYCAAGDDGANDNVYDGKVHVDFPASSPYAIACGGTSLTVSAGNRTEYAWNDGDGSATGGGVSDFFPIPDYQQHANIPNSLSSNFRGRGVPDVSAVADPQTGYAVFVHGRWSIVGGTSAVAPLYAGLTARINARMLSTAGFINSFIYMVPDSKLFNDIANGNNSVDNVQGYNSTSGWDPVTGWGSPNGINLLSFLTDLNSESA